MHIRFCFPIVLLLLILSGAAHATDSAILGGIGTGTVEIHSNGRLGGITINHNPHQPIDDPAGCFAVLSVKSETGTIVKKLIGDPSDPASMQNVRVQKRFPYAVADFSDPSLPLSVSLNAYSPFIPNNKDDSCFPAIVFRYTVQNQSDKAIPVTLAMSWRNMIGRGGTAKETFDAKGTFYHRVIRSGKNSGVLFQQDAPNQTGFFQNTQGEHALVYRASGKETVASLPVWLPEADPLALKIFLEKIETFKRSKDARIEASLSDPRRPAAAVGARQTLPPGESRTFEFILAWYMPHLIAKDGTDYGVYYTERWNSVQKVVDELSKKQGDLEKAMNEWESSYLESTVPSWLFDRMRNGMSVLAKDGVFLKDGRFSILTSNPDYPGNLGALEERLVDAPFLMQCFPDLLRSELEMITNCQLSDGEVPSTAGNLYGVLENGNVPGGFIGNPDSSAAYVLLVYDYYLWTGDREFLDDKYQHVKYALRWLMARDGNGDFVPDGPSLWPWSGGGVASLFSGDLAMAAFRVGEELEQIYRDLEFQTWCRQQAAWISRNLNSQLWNGEYYNSFFDAARPIASDSSSPIAGLFGGEWYAQRHGWNSLLPESKTINSIQALARSLDIASNSSQKEGASRRYGFASAFAGPLLLRYGHLEAVEKLAAFDTDSEAGWWSCGVALAGVGADMHRRCISVGPILSSTASEFSGPFLSPLFSGRIKHVRTRLSGQQECSLTFERAPRGKDATLQQIAFALPPYADVNETVVKVFHNGEPAPGQDFSRERLRAFGFQPSLKVKEGDVLTLLLTSKEGPRIVVDVQTREIRNYGGKCRIDKTGLTVPGVSFYVNNLLRDRQMLSFELTNPMSNQEYAVFVNGERRPYAIPSPEPVPIVLPNSPVSSSDIVLLHVTAKACRDAAVKLSLVSGREGLKKNLWNLQEEADRLVDLDAVQRGIRFDIIPTTVVDQYKLPHVDKNDEGMSDDVERLNGLRQEYMAEIQKETGDPVLASELTGFFVPIDIQSSVSDVVSASESLSFDVRLVNPKRSPVVGRITMELPEGWRSITEDDVAFDDRESPEEERTIHYRLTAPVDLWKKRYPIQTIFSGTWNGYPFRKTQSAYAGHDFVKRWLIVGPFSNERGEGFGKMNPPEINIQTQETYQGIDGDVAWSERNFDGGYIDFDSILTPNDNAVAYAYTSVFMPREGAVQLRVGCNGDLKLFLNYKEVYGKRNVGKQRPGGEAVLQRLYEGWNHLVVKVSERTGPWGFYLEIYDMQGKPIEGIQYALDKAE